MNENETSSTTKHSEAEIIHTEIVEVLDNREDEEPQVKHPYFSVNQKQNGTITTTIQLSTQVPSVFKGFFILHRETGDKYDFEAKELKPETFSFEFNLIDFIHHIVKVPGMKAHFEFYTMLEYFVDDTWTLFETPISLDIFEQFSSVGLTQFKDGENNVFPYFSRKTNGFCITLNAPVRSHRYVEESTIEKIHVKKKEIDILGKVTSRAMAINRIDTIMVGRDTGMKRTIHSNHTLDQLESGTHIYQYEYQIRIQLEEFTEELLLLDMQDDQFDVYFEIYLNGFFEPTRIKVANPTLRASQLLHRNSYYHFGKRTYTFSPLFTSEFNGLTISVTRFEKKNYQFFQELLPIAWLIRWFFYRKNIWVIGERPDEANNTGFYFFKYMREQHPEHPVYYVINPSSKAYHNVASFGEEYLLPYKSRKHIWYLLLSRTIFTSYEPQEIYPTRARILRNLIRGNKIFLQNGLLGLKNLNHTYGRFSTQFDTDLFLVSSKREKNIALHDLHYPEKQVAVTGLSRFDALFDETEAPSVKRQILFMPDDFEIGLHYQAEAIKEAATAFKELLTEQSLVRFYKQNKLDLVMCLPPSMEEYAADFRSLNCHVTFQSDAETMQLMKESLMMITDTNSDALDFSMLHRPVIFYQPELTAYKQSQTNRITMSYGLDIPGEIATTIEALNFFLNRVAVNDFKMTSANRLKADHLVAFRDTNASERIYAVVKHFRKGLTSFFKNWQKNPIIQEMSFAFRKFKERFKR